jgi:hypothetical protein
MRRPSSPVALRYWLARLRPLARPVFWAPSIALLLVMLFTWDFWMRSEVLGYLGIQSGSESDESLSKEDQAIGVDIDTLPVLLDEFGISSKSNPVPLGETASVKPGGTPAPTSLANLPGIPLAGASATASPQTANPSLFGNPGNAFAGTMPNFGLSNNGLTGNTSLERGQTAQPSSMDSLLRSTGSTPSSAESPLQAALTRANATAESSKTAAERPSQTPSSFPSTPSTARPPTEGTTSLGTFGVNGTASSTPSNNSYSSLVEGTQPLSGNSVSPGIVSPPIAPAIAPNLLPSSQSPFSSQPASGQNNLNAAPNIALPQQPQSFPTIDTPFTAPRPIPGRVLGGGQINTFSNP